MTTISSCCKHGCVLHDQSPQTTTALVRCFNFSILKIVVPLLSFVVKSIGSLLLFSTLMSLERIVQNFDMSDKKRDEAAQKDCLGCRLVGGLGCIGMGLYVANQARGTKGITHGGFMLFAASLGVLGTLRLTSTSLFSEGDTQEPPRSQR